jgi:hypothetical protein
LNKELLHTFPPLNLGLLHQRGYLRDRLDHKYVFPANLLETALTQCQNDYDILEIDGHRTFNYITLYFDTADKSAFTDHHRGKGGRYKLRYRHYVESNIQYLEIKWKTNKGRTHKERTAVSEGPELFKLETYTDQLKEHFGLDAGSYTRTLEVRYERMTFLHRTQPEKLTIDQHLRFQNDHDTASFEQLAIAEVKTPRNSTPQFHNIMRSLGIREGGMSKYCLGMIALYPDLKYNLFKQEYLRLQKLNQPDGEPIFNHTADLG